MINGDDLIKKRFLELAERAYARRVNVYTDFLSTHELSLLTFVEKVLPVRCLSFGGADECERRVVCFVGDDDAPPCPPIVCIHIEPRGSRFAEELNHRDYLGSLMALGFERSAFGDIILRDGGAYVFCLERSSATVIDDLREVRRTPVKCSVTTDAIAGALYTLTSEAIQITSERVDAVIARAYKLSREDSLELFRTEKVFINSAACTSQSQQLRAGDVVSVRGRGRFVYRGVQGTSRKGKLVAQIEKYGS